MTTASRVPPIKNIERAHFQFLDAVDRRQQQLANLADLSGTASTADIIAKINEILDSHRTK